MKKSLFVLVALILMGLAIARPHFTHPYDEALTAVDCMYPSYAGSMASAASSYSAPNAMSIYSQISASRSAILTYGTNAQWAQFGAEYATFLSLVNQLQQLYLSYGMSPSGPGLNSLMSNYYGYQSGLLSCLNAEH